jgi:hypothetical protein
VGFGAKPSAAGAKREMLTPACEQSLVAMAAVV